MFIDIYNIPGASVYSIVELVFKFCFYKLLYFYMIVFDSK